MHLNFILYEVIHFVFMCQNKWVFTNDFQWSKVVNYWPFANFPPRYAWNSCLFCFLIKFYSYSFVKIYLLVSSQKYGNAQKISIHYLYIISHGKFYYCRFLYCIPCNTTANNANVLYYFSNETCCTGRNHIISDSVLHLKKYMHLKVHCTS